MGFGDHSERKGHGIYPEGLGVDKTGVENGSHIRERGGGYPPPIRRRHSGPVDPHHIGIIIGIIGAVGSLATVGPLDTVIINEVDAGAASGPVRTVTIGFVDRGESRQGAEPVSVRRSW